MQLIRAELRKLVRPLTWGVAGAAAVFCVLLAVAGAHNAALEGSTRSATSPRVPSSGSRLARSARGPGPWSGPG
jgi:hypothetical protein